MSTGGGEASGGDGVTMTPPRLSGGRVSGVDAVPVSRRTSVGITAPASGDIVGADPLPPVPGLTPVPPVPVPVFGGGDAPPLPAMLPPEPPTPAGALPPVPP